MAATVLIESPGPSQRSSNPEFQQQSMPKQSQQKATTGTAITSESGRNSHRGHGHHHHHPSSGSAATVSPSASVVAPLSTSSMPTPQSRSLTVSNVPITSGFKLSTVTAGNQVPWFASPCSQSATTCIVQSRHRQSVGSTNGSNATLGLLAPVACSRGSLPTAQPAFGTPPLCEATSSTCVMHESATQEVILAAGASQATKIVTQLSANTPTAYSGAPQQKQRQHQKKALHTNKVVTTPSSCTTTGFSGDAGCETTSRFNVAAAAPVAPPTSSSTTASLLLPMTQNVEPSTINGTAPAPVVPQNSVRGAVKLKLAEGGDNAPADAILTSCESDGDCGEWKSVVAAAIREAAAVHNSSGGHGGGGNHGHSHYRGSGGGGRLERDGSSSQEGSQIRFPPQNSRSIKSSGDSSSARQGPSLLKALSEAHLGPLVKSVAATTAGHVRHSGDQHADGLGMYHGAPTIPRRPSDAEFPSDQTSLPASCKEARIARAITVGRGDEQHTKPFVSPPGSAESGQLGVASPATSASCSGTSALAAVSVPPAGSRGRGPSSRSPAIAAAAAFVAIEQHGGGIAANGGLRNSGVDGPTRRSVPPREVGQPSHYSGTATMTTRQLTPSAGAATLGNSTPHKSGRNVAGAERLGHCNPSHDSDQHSGGSTPPPAALGDLYKDPRIEGFEGEVDAESTDGLGEGDKFLHSGDDDYVARAVPRPAPRPATPGVVETSQSIGEVPPDLLVAHSTGLPAIPTGDSTAATLPSNRVIASPSSSEAIFGPILEFKQMTSSGAAPTSQHRPAVRTSGSPQGPAAVQPSPQGRDASHLPRSLRKDITKHRKFEIPGQQQQQRPPCLSPVPAIVNFSSVGSAGGTSPSGIPRPSALPNGNTTSSAGRYVVRSETANRTRARRSIQQQKQPTEPDEVLPSALGKGTWWVIQQKDGPPDSSERSDSQLLDIGTQTDPMPMCDQGAGWVNQDPVRDQIGLVPPAGGVFTAAGLQKLSWLVEGLQDDARKARRRAQTGSIKILANVFERTRMNRLREVYFAIENKRYQNLFSDH